MTTFLAWLAEQLRSLWAAFTAGGAQAPAASEPQAPAPAAAEPAEQPAAAPAWTPGGLTLPALGTIMPQQRAAVLGAYWPYLTAAMVEFSIITPARAAAFLAQLAHESGELRYMEELASGAAYEGRADLGNTEPGDGVRYKGRGPIQLTGRANYRLCGAALGLDLEGDPAQAATPQVGFRIAGWYWTTHPTVTRNCNALADEGDFLGVTRAVNGGLNGLASREAYWARAREVLGC